MPWTDQRPARTTGRVVGLALLWTLTLLAVAGLLWLMGVAKQ